MSETERTRGGPTACPEWHRLEALATADDLGDVPSMFAADEARVHRFTLTPFDDLVVDFSKHRVDAKVHAALLDLARARAVAEGFTEMFGGAPINVTERRAALHAALRTPPGNVMKVDGVDVMPDVEAVRAQMLAFVRDIRAGRETSADGGAWTDVVNIGIGGSDLGPRMVTEALAPYASESLRVHFVSNVDGSDLSATLANLDPRRTMLVVVSKTFTTQETMTNAASALRWLRAGLEDHGAEVSKHLVAVTSAPERARAFGVEPGRTFKMWDWVGGRYSLWSAAGLSIALSIGPEHFEALLAGAHEMDQHVREAPLAENVPVTLGLLGVWCTNFLGMHTHAVLPYDQRLRSLAAYLQQADMESNGKSTLLDGQRVTGFHTGPVVWGAPGTNGQHAFYQLMHQGTRVVPADFLVAANASHELEGHHEILLANALAQSQALMVGRDLAAARAMLEPEDDAGLAAHRVFEGSRPSTTVLYASLDPRTLGRLIAMYEHKIFVQARIWGINPFDQWGVELGKTLANGLRPAIDGEAPPSTTDASTRQLLAHVQRMRKKP